MQGIVFTKQTSTIALVFFIAYVIYGFLYFPFTQYLVSLAIGGIAFGLSESYEIAVLAVLLMNLFYPFVGPIQYAKAEGFQNSKPQEIRKRIQSMQQGTYGKPEPEGVSSPLSEGFACPMNYRVEGFEDASGNDVPKNPTTISEQGVPPANQPATAMTETKKKEPTATASTEAPASTGVTTEGATKGAPVTSGFQDNSALFKLGQIPVDEKGGHHIDAGTTVLNALQALKPDQIKAMTQDTKQLIETQKSLMGMLQTFQPMMMEGKQMMDTFNQMFAPTSGATGK